jgi:hypothetical protein
MTVKAVIFDIGKNIILSSWYIYIDPCFFKGGVCVGSPMAGIHRFEETNGLPRNYINVAM